MSVLNKIIEHKLKEVRGFKSNNDIKSLKDKAINQKQGINFLSALKESKYVPIIAEIKKKSPSKGSLNESVDVVGLAKTYEKCHASAISVLTDFKHFGGDIGDLIKVKESVNLPVLRKDFIIDPVQVYEAKASGASAILLIAEALEGDKLKILFELTKSLFMTPLLEIHEEAQIDRVLELEPDLIGINNRNLVTLEVDIFHCIKLRKNIPGDIFVVAESGIQGKDDILKLQNEGLNAFLIGTTLMKSKDPGQMLKILTTE